MLAAGDNQPFDAVVVGLRITRGEVDYTVRDSEGMEFDGYTNRWLEARVDGESA